MSVRLDGKAIVITGSGRGIGEACARHAAGLGAFVIVNDLDADNANRVAESIRSGGAVAFAHPADISDRSQALDLIGRCIQEYGRIDGLVNNAALMILGRLDSYDEVRLRRVLDVNVVGGFNCAAAAIAHMYSQGGGSIVNVTSGAHLGMADMSDYAASKGAIASMTYAWAADAAQTNVRINAISPLAASTMSRDAHSYFVEEGKADSVIEAPSPASNAPLVSYLLSDASMHLRGQVVRVAGSVLALMAHPSIMQPCLHRDVWSSDDIERAFADVLADRQAPLGLSWTAQPPSSQPPTEVNFSDVADHQATSDQASSLSPPRGQ